ncbi:hypothetical protein E2542_SST14228 [Spatholobus suberectus]|nr:hypothetical protein E2542_SST14228 [Spatholobus suberectus]
MGQAGPTHTSIPLLVHCESIGSQDIALSFIDSIPFIIFFIRSLARRFHLLNCKLTILSSEYRRPKLILLVPLK